MKKTVKIVKGNRKQTAPLPCNPLFGR